MKKKQLGTLIKLRRMSMTISAHDLAKAIEATTATVHKYESGEIWPSVPRFLAIRDELKITDSDLDDIDEVIRKMWTDLMPV